jgi:hypothetical protein
MVVIEAENIRDTIKGLTIHLPSYPDDFLGFYQVIANCISAEKEKIKELDVDLIVVENLYKDYHRSEVSQNIIIQKKERETINILILGDLEPEHQIVWKFSEVFADFYVEFLLLPIFHTFNYRVLAAIKSDVIQKFKEGIIVYECERNLHRNSATVY